jgi:hypothetical protein
VSTFTSTSTGIVLNNPTAQNPATIVSGAYVRNTTTVHGGDAVYGTSYTQGWNVYNFGSVNSTAGVGIFLSTGRDSTVTNAAAPAQITGYFNGISLNFSRGTVINSGTVAATATAQGSGVYFANGGVLTNQAGGLITANQPAVAILASAGTITNSGTIQSTGAHSGVYLGAGGTVTNAATSSLIQGGLSGVYIGGSAGTSAISARSRAPARPVWACTFRRAAALPTTPAR